MKFSNNIYSASALTKNQSIFILLSKSFYLYIFKNTGHRTSDIQHKKFTKFAKK